MAQTKTVIPTGSAWKYRKGTSEASSPTSAWRGNGFDDSGWSTGNAPFHYGSNAIGGDDDVFTGTIFSDMRYNYRCIFLRHAFVVTNLANVQSLSLTATCDDGFVAWVNGVEVARSRFSGEPFYTSQATEAIEPAETATFTAANAPSSYLVAGTNVLIVQVFNGAISSSDLRFDTTMEITELTPLTVTNIIPADGASLSALTQITVWFNKPVAAVHADDLLINGLPASGLAGLSGTNIYTFTFTQPQPGTVNVAWNGDNQIGDLFGTPFLGTPWSYTLADVLPPEVIVLTPMPGAQVGRLARVEVTFNETVTGVDAADLLVNGQPAVSVNGSGSGPYLFQFPQPADGNVQFSWKAGHGIADQAAAPNPFAGGSWNVTLSSGIGTGDVIINEFVAGNTIGLLDEDNERQDWIELHNRGTNAVNLLGWSLTDDPDVPTKWTFPAQMIAPGDYLVVFASAKDRRAPTGGNRYHTNFKLNQFGDYLALFNAESPGVAVSEFAPGFPEQRNNYSYGLDATNAWRYFQTPTPGAANGSSTITALAPPPHFSVERGCFDAPFNVLLTTTIPGATIRYTTDGREPTLAVGQTYLAPLLITNTANLRAAVFASNYLPSRTRTESYIFLDAVLNQPNNPPGFPTTWGNNSVFASGVVPADYEMDLDPLRTDPNNPASPIDPEKLQRYKEGLRELPVVSITMSMNDLFNPSGIYSAANVVNKSFPDKPCAIEMILPNGETAFTADVGLSIHGNASREPYKNPKHGFKISFKGDYGESELHYKLFPDSPADVFDDLILRPDFNASWRHWNSYDRPRASRMRDAWMKETMRDMGQIASHNRYFHLFINGLYWGTYDFSEQPTSAFGRNYLGANFDFDVYDQGAFSEGTTAAFNAMTAIAGLSDNARYEQLKQYLDMPGFIDYMLLHFWVGHEDWGYAKNWYAIRPRVNGAAGVFHYVPWDCENILREPDVNRVSNTDVPSGLHTKLDDNAQYRLDFADRVHKQMIAPDGALTQSANTGRWLKWLAVVDKPVVAESVRWGDYRRDVHQYQSGPYELYTRENHWLTESNRIVASYLATRNATVLDQLRAAGLYPNVAAPEYRQNNVAGTFLGSSRVPAGTVVAMKNPGGAGTILYTTNGTDPRVYYAGTIASSAAPYSGAITLNATATLKARVLNGGVWSALNEATFTVGELGVPLRITEINYNPVGGDAYEFIEVQNIGAMLVDASAFSFDGVDFIFPDGSVIAPGAVIVLGSSANTNAFATRYPSVAVFGWFGGSLSNGGERIAILDRDGQTVTAVHYDDEDGWPTAPDGGGYSLELVDLRGDPDAPANWRASSSINGTPGLPPTLPAPVSVVINEVMADNASTITNGGALPDWIELHNSGASDVNLAGWSLSDDSDARKFVFPSVNLTAGGYLVIWCDSETAAPGLHSGFALSRKGDNVFLFDANTNRVDAVTFGLQVADLTVGRLAGAWQLTTPTPGAANLAATLAASTNLAINEWLANPPAGGADWIELFNRSSNAPVSLRGIYLGTSNALFQLTALSFLPPLGHVQLIADENGGADHLELKLPASGGAISLFSDTAEPLDTISYGSQTEGVSEGRLPDGAANIQTFNGSASPGAGNYVLAWSGPVLNEVLARNNRVVAAPWGNYADFIELHNSAGSAFSLDGMSLGTSSDGKNRWEFPPGASIPAGGYLCVWCDGSRAASMASGPGMNTGFSLDGDSGEVYLLNSTAQPVDWIRYGFQVRDVSIGQSGGQWRLLTSPTPGAANSTAATLGGTASLRINEWMAGTLDGDDWFELYNTSSFPVALGGLFLSDNPSIAGKTNFQIAPLSFVGGRDWVKWVADGHVANGRNHAGFALDNLGETLRLYDTNLAIIDAVDFGVQSDGVSQGRLPDGSADIVSFPATATPGDANYVPTAVVINEVLTHTDPPLEDAIELFNPTATNINIGGWYISDSAGDLMRYRIPDGTVISHGGFKVFYQYQFGPADGETDSPPLFTFNSAHGDEAYLSAADGGGELTGERAVVKFGAAANGTSFGRFPTSVGVDFVAMSERTFGADTPSTLAAFRAGAGESNGYPLVGPVVINEILYHPTATATNETDEEFIELYNLGALDVPLFDPEHPTNTWRFDAAVSFDFPANTFIPANGYLLVVGFNPTNAAALANFRSRYGTNGIIVGPYSGKLDNSGESVELYRPDTPQAPPHPDAGFVPFILADRVVYSDTPPWPAAADGTGSSLQRILPANYGNDPVNWIASPPTAGMVNDLSGATDSDGDGVPDWWEQQFGTEVSIQDGDADPDHDGFSNRQEFQAGTNPHDPASALRVGEISVANGAVTLQFQAMANHSYSVLHSPSLEGPWSKLADVPAQSANRMAGATNGISPSGNHFYRVVTPVQP